MSCSDGLVYAALMLVMGVMGAQDWRARRVSNRLTIPFFTAGLLINVLRAFVDFEWFVLALWMQGVVMLAGRFNWMGGADMKVYVGLAGLLPEAGMAALLVNGVAGAFVWARAWNRRAQYPAVAVSALAVAMAWVARMW